MIVPDVVLSSRLSMAMPSVVVTSAAICEESIDQPTILRENVSSTAQLVVGGTSLGISRGAIFHARVVWS